MTYPALTPFSRRTALRSLAGAGVSAAFLGGPASAETLKGRKLVVVIARGALDGLSVTVPIGDARYYALRQSIAVKPEKTLPIDALFGLHPKLVAYHGLMAVGEARFAPAVALPQRIRSHFEAQDLLETGGAGLYQASTGWLNRALQAGGAAGPMTALAVGAQEPLILRGPAATQSWSPGGRVDAQTGRLASSLMDLYADDPLLGPALANGLSVENQAEVLTGGQPMQGRDGRALAATAGRFVAAPSGPTIAVLSLDGFDTHARQGAEDGQLANRLGVMDAALAGLKEGLGDQWFKTVVVVVTEFGRTARVNGTGGTDHGTASTLLLAGGALKAGGMVGDWPTLAEGRLFEDRDLAPSLDVRSVFKGLLRDHLGVDRKALETRVFPNSLEAPATMGLVA